ncbi:MAG: HAMP domain-containing protein [Candidatus Aminicenantes bacterium]|nr:HAMP domain-containing protein [Candidatus Aminicenantes bacterium]
MIIGYLIVVLLVVVINSYSMLKLSQLNKNTNSILTIDQPSIDNEKKMIDSLLSQVRNEQKYLITQDMTFYKLFQSHSSDFTEHLNQLSILLDTPEENRLKDRIKDLHYRYCLLVTKEINSLKNNEASRHQYEKEKNEIVDRLNGTIDKLITLSQTTINNKVKYSKKIGARAILTAQGLVILNLILGITLAFFITRSIDKPLKKLEAKTKHIADGNFDSQIEINSPAELAELASSFNQMCNRLKEIDEMKSGFISHVSHELRTPFTSINEANRLLLDKAAGNITEKQERLLKIIEQGNNKLIRLINELLDLSKMEAGMMDYNLVRADISQIIEQNITDIKLLTEKKDILIHSSVEKGLPLITMDIDKIQQVLNNLLSNAVKFTPEKGTVKVNAKLIRIKNQKLKAEDNHFIQVGVSDTGVGIPQEHLNKVFDKFQQVSPEGTGSIKGTGLGLSIAKHIVEAHKGKIWAESQTGKGSTFTFILPVDEKTDTNSTEKKRRNNYDIK